MWQILLLLLIQNAASQALRNILLQKQIYDTNLDSSICLEKEDQSLRNSWAVGIQVKRVNVITKYRMQMNLHREHNFRRTDNSKWSECVFLHRREIRQSVKQYYADENECLITTTVEEGERTRSVEQLDKESRKWRKGYRYLVNKCNTDNSDDGEASILCLIEYMEKDHYDKVIRRLMTLKLEAMGKLFLKMYSSVQDLEQCLETQLSIYLEKVREVMVTLNDCYSFTEQSDNEDMK